MAFPQSRSLPVILIVPEATSGKARGGIGV
jgi:hypothetical protein